MDLRPNDNNTLIQKRDFDQGNLLLESYLIFTLLVFSGKNLQNRKNFSS